MEDYEEVEKAEELHHTQQDESIKKLKNAFMKYGRHLRECASRRGGICNCGYTKVFRKYIN